MRDMVFGMGACTTSNYVKQFRLPGDYSCICSYELLDKAVRTARERGFSYHVGNILSSDMFYNPDIPPMGVTWDKMGVLVVLIYHHIHWYPLLLIHANKLTKIIGVCL